MEDSAARDSLGFVERQSRRGHCRWCSVYCCPSNATAVSCSSGREEWALLLPVSLCSCVRSVLSLHLCIRTLGTADGESECMLPLAVHPPLTRDVDGMGAECKE